MIDPVVFSNTGVPSVTACNPHPLRGAPLHVYPREVWVDRPLWGLGVRRPATPGRIWALITAAHAVSPPAEADTFRALALRHATAQRTSSRSAELPT